MSPQPERSDSIKHHKIETPSEEVLKHWTKERMRKAKATNMPHLEKPAQEKQPPQRKD